MTEIQYPITVQGIEFDGKDAFTPLRHGKKVCGQFVKVRPCADEFGGKTFLGILLGDIALLQSAYLDPKSGILKVCRTMYNPAIFVPDRNAVVFGCESWWEKINSADELSDITDTDISNIWYVRALKQLSEEGDNEKT